MGKVCYNILVNRDKIIEDIKAAKLDCSKLARKWSCSRAFVYNQAKKLNVELPCGNRVDKYAHLWPEIDPLLQTMGAKAIAKKYNNRPSETPIRLRRIKLGLPPVTHLRSSSAVRGQRMNGISWPRSQELREYINEIAEKRRVSV